MGAAVVDPDGAVQVAVFEAPVGEAAVGVQEGVAECGHGVALMLWSRGVELTVSLTDMGFRSVMRARRRSPSPSRQPVTRKVCQLGVATPARFTAGRGDRLQLFFRAGRPGGRQSGSRPPHGKRF